MSVARWIAALGLGAVLAAMTGCQRTEPAAPGETSAWIVLVPELDSDQSLEPLRVEPTVRSLTRVGGRIVVEVEAGRDVRITPHEGCSVLVDAKSLAPGERIERGLSDWFGFGGPRVAEGYGETVRLSATPRCDEAKRGALEWRRVGGPPGSELVSADEGRTVEVRLPSRAEAQAFLSTPGAPDTPGPLVGISPRTRGTVELEVVWRRPNAEPVTRRVSLSAAARLRALPNVAVNTSVALHGSGWQPVGEDAASGTLGEGGAANAEHGSGAGLGHSDESGNFWLDMSHVGRTELSGVAHARLSLRAERLDATPLDCGRAECHRAIAESAATSPMTTVLARLLGEPASALKLAAGQSYPACAVGCHAVGEPGVDDGGFVGALHAHGLRVADLTGARIEDVPSAARKLAGVGCLGCHGPAAIPEPELRWTMLQTDVCAACHDAPPRYGHVVAFLSSGMGHGAQARLAADKNDRSTHDPKCASCHTTAGFLRRLGDTEAEAPPALGLTCVTCHDAHPAPAPAGPGLFRRVEKLPSLLGERAASVPDSVRPCVSCHAPPDPLPTPESAASAANQPLGPTQAAVLAGRGGLDPLSGESLLGAAPHWAIAGGCVGCHDQGPAELQRGQDHAFRASPDDCSCCHESKPLDLTLRERARRVLEELGKQGIAWAGEAARRAQEGKVNAAETARAPSHARALPEISLATPRERAAYDALLVYEDAGAIWHNQPYARALVEAAEKAVSTNGAAHGH